jgi:4-diphosphocytidyl-2-C-methyl-D-erythritol kinase
MKTAPITITAPAKINLYLHILGRRADGYHDLETVFIPIADLADVIRLEGRDSGGIRLECGDQRVPCDDTNLCWRAAAAFSEAAGLSINVSMHIDKKIPVAAGLGGGSSDAAAVLGALNLLHGKPLSDATLHEIARKLGADVPFFLDPRPALARGIGDKLTPVPCAAPVPVVIVNPGFPLSTRWAYQHVQFQQAVPPPVAGLLHGLAEGDLAMTAASAFNVFEEISVAKFPLIEMLLEHLCGEGCLAAHLCGSGPTVYGICSTRREAEAAARNVNAQFGSAVRAWAAAAG